MRIQSPAVLVNAGSREGADRLGEVVAALGEFGIQPRFTEALEGRELSAALERAVNAKPDCLIACGGDGTVASCAAVAIEHDWPLGVIALGTGNSFARKIGLDPGVESGAKAIGTGNLAWMDVGRAGEALFLDLCSVGVSADVVRHVKPELKKTWGRLAYILAGAEALAEIEAFSVRIEANGRVIELESLFVACGPGPLHGGFAKLHPDARPNDGLLYGYALDASSRAVLIQWAAGIAIGDPGALPGIVAFTGDTIQIATSPPLATNLDGEKHDPTPVTLTAGAKALRVFAPEAS